MNIYTDRLVKEWIYHGKIVLAVDFDSTISPWKTIDNQKDIDRAIELIKKCQNTGCYVVIHTACDSDRHESILEYCKSVGIVVDSINKNPIDLPYGNKGSKIFYNHQLCDRSGFIGAMDILEQALYSVRGIQQYEKSLDDFG